MASLKEVKTRINSVKSTRKITSAMKMVASAKLHKAQGAIENMLPYQKKLNKILTNFLSADLPIESPYVQEREVKRVAIVVFSSNTSLCGAFNANVIKMMMQTIGEFRTLGQDNILIFPVGKKVDEAAKYRDYFDFSDALRQTDVSGGCRTGSPTDGYVCGRRGRPCGNNLSSLQINGDTDSSP